MNLVVVDTGVFVSGVFWRNEPYFCLQAWFQGIIIPVISDEILAEYETALLRIKREEGFKNDIYSWLAMLRTSALIVTPVALQTPVCRDPKDDKFIEAALDCGSRTIIARDQDLTVLEKPFGIQIITPRARLGSLPRRQRRQLAS